VNNAAKTLIIIGKECNKKFLNNIELIKCKIDEKGLNRSRKSYSDS